MITVLITLVAGFLVIVKKRINSNNGLAYGDGADWCFILPAWGRTLTLGAKSEEEALWLAEEMVEWSTQV